MEADWEFEVGNDAPIIEPAWPGFIDLRRHPERARELSETTQLPALAEALQTLNSKDSSVWTSKCDVWPLLLSEDFDARELDAPTGYAAHAIACYIDLLQNTEALWQHVPQVEAVCRTWCASLKEVRMLCCRVDLVVRRAFFVSEVDHMGITAYITACGRDPGEARITLEHALCAFASTAAPGNLVSRSLDRDRY